MSLNPADRQKLKDAFNTWVKQHPAPDTPDIRTGNGVYTPRQLVQAINDDTEEGKEYLDMFEYSVTSGRQTLDQLISLLTRPSKPPTP